jgi:phosphoserine phosphatase RsbU/P
MYPLPAAAQTPFPGSDLNWPTLSLAILLVALFLSALILLRRYRSRRLLMAQVAELEALSEAGRAIVAAQLNVASLCQLIAAEAGKVIDNRTFQIGLLEGDLYHIQIWSIDGVEQAPRTFDLGENGGLVGWMRESRQPLLVHDFQREMASLPARPRYISEAPPRSAVFIPLVSGNDVIGVIAAQSNQPGRFSHEDMRRLMILANQAAAAIANARLFEQEQSRAAHLELVGQIARQVNAIQDLDELFEEVVRLTQDTFGFSAVNIFGVDGESGEAVIKASSIAGLTPGCLRLAPNQGLVGTALATRQTTLAGDTREDSRFLADPGLSGIDAPETRAEIVIPLIVNEEMLGVLDVHGATVGAFTAQEQTVLEALAAQIAIAIYKARQFAVQREQAWLTTAQLQMAEAISNSSDLEELLATMARLVPLLTGVTDCAFLLWDVEIKAYGGGALYGRPALDQERFESLALPIGVWPPLDAVHVGMSDLTTNQPPPWRSEDEQSALQEGAHEGSAREGGAHAGDPNRYSLYPLVAQGQMLGVMVVHEPPDRDETVESGMQRRSELLRGLAHQATQALESAQLRIAQQEEAWVNTALLQVAEAVNSLIDLNEILHTIVRLVPMLVGVDSCLILIWDEEKQCYHAGPSHGLSEMSRGVVESFEIEPSDFTAVAVQETGRLNTDVTFYTVRLPLWLETALATKTAYAFPLNARGRLVGNMMVGPPANGRPLSGRRLNILTGIAQQAAIAVVNDHLYRESAERDRMDQELNVARSIQASLMPDGNPNIPGCDVASYWQAARQVSGDFYDFMALANGCWGIAVADVADKGVPAALFMALSRTILRTVAFNRPRPAEVLQRTNQIIFNDSQSGLFVTIFYAIWDAASETMTYANGGHNPPLLLQRNGRCRTLSADGMALGVLEDVEIAEKKVRLQPGDSVIFYTDGVTEALNEDQDEFGIERLTLTATRARKSDAHAIMAAITSAIQDHAGDTPQFDDITLVVLKRHERQSADSSQQSAES